MAAENTIRILIIDDHQVVREGLKAMILTQPDLSVIAEASDGTDAVSLFQKHRPDVVLMDLEMPVTGGLDATRALMESFPGARIIVLTVHKGDEDIHHALHAGARGYLWKDAPGTQLMEAIRMVHSGHRYISSAVAKQLAERPPASELTSREMEILTRMMRGKSNKQIAEELSIAEPTVKFHVSNILVKLEASDRTQAVTNAIRRGILHLE